LPVNGYPYANNLQAFTGSYCTGIPGAGLAIFRWNYQHTLRMGEVKFEFQVDDNSNFLSPEVDRVYDNLNYAAGDLNQQTVIVQTDPPPYYCDANNLSNQYPNNLCNHINFNTGYYWRVKVWAKDYTPSEWEQASGVFTYGYTHPCPDPNYPINPYPPIKDTVEIFTDTSVCYTSAGTIYPCKTSPGITNTYTWDFGDGSAKISTSYPNNGNVSHTYTSTGSHYSSLKVCDEIGCGFKSKNIFISPGSSTLPVNKEVPPF
jgi:hypothetical protein